MGGPTHGKLVGIVVVHAVPDGRDGAEDDVVEGPGVARAKSKVASERPGGRVVHRVELGEARQQLVVLRQELDTATLVVAHARHCVVVEPIQTGQIEPGRHIVEGRLDAIVQPKDVGVHDHVLLSVDTERERETSVCVSA